MSQDVDKALDETNLNLVPLLRHFEDKRRFPRVDVRTDVLVTTSDHQELTARMRNLSAEGMQARCDPDTARRIHPAGTQVVGDRGPVVKLQFELDTASGRSAFLVEGQMRYLTPKDRESIALGFKFIGVSLDVKKRLGLFLIDCMRPQF